MDIQRFFKILEVDRGATLDEVKQAYKDIVNVWHPDRFSNNPRLRQKAEEKLKEANLAYETVKSFLSSKKHGEHGRKKAAQTKAGARDKTEVAAEAGTRIVLNVCSYLYQSFRRLVVSQAAKIEAEEKAQGQDGLKGGKAKRREP
jgi:curved DNA-binding protein CbpA